MEIQWNTQTVGEVVKANMHAAGIFERHGVDYCCGGRQTLTEACERGDVDTAALKQELADLPEGGAPNVAAWDTPCRIQKTRHRGCQLRGARSSKPRDFSSETGRADEKPLNHILSKRMLTSYSLI